MVSRLREMPAVPYGRQAVFQVSGFHPDTWALPLPFPQALFKGLDPKLLIRARFFVILTPAPIFTFPQNLFFDSLTPPDAYQAVFFAQL